MLDAAAASWGGDGVGVTGLSPASATPSFDAELGQIFIRMRNLLGISLWDMARRVGAEPTVIADLEAGALNALPPWPELTRLVDAYAAAAGVDHQPILARLLRTQIPVGASTAAGAAQFPKTITVNHPQPAPRAALTYAGMSAAPIPDTAFVTRTETPRTEVSIVPTAARRTMPGQRAQAHTPARAVNAEFVPSSGSPRIEVPRALGSTWRGFKRFARRQLTMTGVLIFLPSLLLVLAWQVPATLYAILSPLPPVVANPLKLGTDFLVTTLAPSREGLTWIDIGDPRLRKSDRLPDRAR